jgi:hypothetical protein
LAAIALNMRTTFILVLTLTTNILFGQEEKGLDFGFNISIIQRSNLLALSDNITFDNVQNSNRWGFDLGFSFYYVFNDKFELRTTPTMGFEEDEIVYERLSSSEKLMFGPVFVKLPTHAIFKIHEKVPLGIMLGITPCIQISQSEDAPTDKIEFKKYDMSADIGLNYAINFPWFIFCPEIRYSKSFINSASDDRTQYGQAVSEFYRDKFVFGFYIRSTIYR